MPDLSIEPFDAQSPLFPGVADLFRATWADKFDTVDEASTPMLRHMTYPGYKGVLAVTEQRRVVGLCYGYTDLPGQWWHEKVAQVLGPERTQAKLTESLCLTELAVDAAYRRRGLGRRLHDTLLQGVPHRSAVLSTQCDNHPAQAMYARLGWSTLVERMEFVLGGQPYTILWRPLPQADPTQPDRRPHSAT